MSNRLVIKSESERIVLGEVYAPMQIDTDGEAMTAEEIKKMAYGFMRDGLTDKIDLNHNYQETGCYVVESFLACPGDPRGFIEDSWVLGVKIEPDQLWEKVLNGEVNGYSFCGGVKKKQITAKIQVVRRMSGVTEKSTSEIMPAHSHQLDITFNDDGKIIQAMTDEKLDHFHDIKKTTATEKMLGHSHRIILIDN